MYRQLSISKRMAYGCRQLAAETRSFSLFATHFQELTLLEQELPSVVNRHVSAIVTESGLTLLYQLKPGPSDRSFGIEVARMAKLPQHVVQVLTARFLI